MSVGARVSFSLVASVVRALGERKVQEINRNLDRWVFVFKFSSSHVRKSGRLI